VRRTLTAVLIATALSNWTFANARQAPPASPPIPPGAEQVYTALSGRFDRTAMLEIVTFMDQYWRLAGNPGYNASIDHIRDLLTTAGFAGEPASPPPIGTVRVEEFPIGGHGWDYRVGTLAFDGSSEPALLSRDVDHISLAINSFSSDPGGQRAAQVDGCAGAEAVFAGKEIRGAIVLGDAPLSRLWQEAVKKRGAAGVV
jgi:aminopeptidase YwaD